MSDIGQFEIVSPIFSGALDTSTARDTQSGETVLLHLLPSGHHEKPQDLFKAIASDWPGQVLDSGFDPETQRSFVVTEYPKDRKAFRVLIKTLSELTVPATAAVAAAISFPPSKPPAPVLTAATRMFDPSALFGSSAPVQDATLFDPAAVFAAAGASPAPSESPTPNGATRMFDPGAVFAAAAPPTAGATPPTPASDGATRMFDPSAVFGGPASTKPAPPAVPPPDGATKIFDPSAVFGYPAPAKPAPPAASGQDGATRIFDPAAIFGAPAAKPSAPPKPKEPADSSKRAAEDFILGRLPAEFRDAPVKVQRSLEELLGQKAKDGLGVPPTPGRPGVITLMFDAYGTRIETAEAGSAAVAERTASPRDAAEEAGARPTRIVSSSDLSAFFGPEAAPGQSPSELETSVPDLPRADSPDRK